MQTGKREGKLAADRLSDFPDLSGADKDDIIRQLDIISIHLEELEKSSKPSGNYDVPDSSDDEVECDFKDTCYASKSKNGQCPCELRR